LKHRPKTGNFGWSAGACQQGMRPQLVGGGFGAQFSQPRHPDGECDIEPELAARQVHRGGGKREFGKLFFKGHADLAGTRTQKSEGPNRASAPFCGSRWRSTWASIKFRASRLEKPAASATCSKSSTCRLQTARSVALSRAPSAPSASNSWKPRMFQQPVSGSSAPLRCNALQCA